MAIEFGAEFNANATPSQEMLLRLRMLAENGALNNAALGKGDANDSAARQLDTMMAMTELQRRLADPEYAALYNQVSDELDDAYDAVAQAREALEAEQADLDFMLTEMRSRAATLEDGTHVYRRNDGAWLTEEGEEVAADEIAQADVPENATRWEEVSPVLGRSREIETQQAELDRMENDVLNPGRARLEDEGNPISEDELADLRGSAASVRKSANSMYAQGREHTNADHAPATRSAADEHMPEGRINAPNMNGEFAAASAPSDPADLDLDLDTPARPSVDAPGLGAP